MSEMKGYLRKMQTSYHEDTEEVRYALNLADQEPIPLNSLVGQTIDLKFTGSIRCIHCKKEIPKSYQGGYCYPCTQKLAECDFCIVRPEKCHFHVGTCRDEEFGKKHCFQQHTLYLARSSGIKIGITRTIQQLHRWMDQGALEIQVLGFFEDRYHVGVAEASISKHMSDKTNWRKMLKNEVTDEPFEKFISLAQQVLSEEQKKALVEKGKKYRFQYPVETYPQKVVSKSLDKLPEFKQKLLGIKGQYLILESHVLNLRSHAGYQVLFSY